MPYIEKLEVPINCPKIRLRLLKGEDIVEQLERLADHYNRTEQNFGFAEFRMVGAVSHVNYQISEIDKDKETKKPLINRPHEAELLFCYGTIAWDSKDVNSPKVHGHIVFADNDSWDSEKKVWRNGNEEYVAFGGHLNKGTKVSITAEIIVEVLSSKKIFRENDTRPDYGGANLWQPFGTKF